MRPVPPRPWPAAALLVALAGCHVAPQRPADESLPGGLVPYSYRMRSAPDASRLVTHPAPPREPAVVKFEAPPAALSRPEPPGALIEWHADLGAAGTAAWIERPAPAPPNRIAVSELPVYAHAADYRWLLGGLEFEAGANRWSVRYANPGEPDRHGGLLELVNTGPMEGFRPGTLVRVEGELVDPQPHQIKPAFRVRSLQALRR